AISPQPPVASPLAAIRAAAREALTSFRESELAQIRVATALTLNTPEIRARAMDELTRTMDAIAAAIGQRVGRSPQDMPVRVLAGSVIGVIMSVTMPWSDWTSESTAQDLFDRIDDALALLESGPQLWPSAPRT